jgi:phosphatidylethanolamine/phosphatidyl-N-methylethanolamine N-methyltransferase
MLSHDSPSQEHRSKFFFLKQYLRRPFGTGAVAPSGQRLAHLMVAQADLRVADLVVELGPGTGVFTRELLARGVRPENLILVETNPHFVKFLRHEFPNVTVLEGDASNLVHMLRGLGHPHVDKVISGIPFRSLKPQARIAITRAVADALSPGGVMVQFSYFNAHPLPKSIGHEMGLTGHRAALALNNVPPAFVWKYRKNG